VEFFRVLGHDFESLRMDSGFLEAEVLRQQQQLDGEQLCVCVCVCVCARARARARQNMKECAFVCTCVCVRAYSCAHARVHVACTRAR